MLELYNLLHWRSVGHDFNLSTQTFIFMYYVFLPLDHFTSYISQVYWILCTHIQKAHTSLGTSSICKSYSCLLMHVCILHENWQNTVLLGSQQKNLMGQEVPKLVYSFWTCKLVSNNDWLFPYFQSRFMTYWSSWKSNCKIPMLRRLRFHSIIHAAPRDKIILIQWDPTNSRLP